MDTLDAEALAAWSGGKWRQEAPRRIVGLSNDTRSLQAGELFIALKTSRRDGHDFLEEAAKRGAAGALVSRARPELDFPQLEVEAVGPALLRMARAYRDRWAARVVGITGSCGKTTCKELLSLLLGREETLSTRGNLNNAIGVPMSMLRPEASRARFAALEAGISEPGEMARLAGAIDPELAIVTAIGPAHLQELGSLEGIAREKGELTAGDRVTDVLLGETAAPYRRWLGGEKATVVAPERGLDALWSYAVDRVAGGSRLRQRLPDGVREFEYAGGGFGLASNVALAVAAATRLGVGEERIRSRLASWRSGMMRGEWRQYGFGRAYVDCYNANPMSMADAIATFVADTPEDEARLFLLGGMEELGPEASAWHERLGEQLPFRETDFLLVIGSEASSVLRGMRNAGHDMERCGEIASAEEARERLVRFAGNVLLKGSRRYRLEEALAGLEVLAGGKEGSRC